MIKPLFQGKLDTFCAIYAVLNALRLMHGIRTLKAREILNETLLALAASPDAFRAVLTQETDYVQLVDTMLRAQSRKFPMEIVQPFAASATPDRTPEEDTLWTACRQWLAPGKGRTIIFRFLRSLTPESGPVNRHWTTVDWMDDHVLHLFDCSHEAEAILNIRRESFVTRPQAVSRERLLLIQPETMRFLRLPF